MKDYSLLRDRCNKAWDGLAEILEGLSHDDAANLMMTMNARFLNALSITYADETLFLREVKEQYIKLLNEKIPLVDDAVYLCKRCLDGRRDNNEVMH